MDVQPEVDLSPSETAAASMGLVVSSGLILGTGIGAMVGHSLLDNAFGLGEDFLVGAIIGAILLGSLAATVVMAITAWYARHEVDVTSVSPPPAVAHASRSRADTSRLNSGMDDGRRPR